MAGVSVCALRAPSLSLPLSLTTFLISLSLSLCFHVLFSVLLVFPRPHSVSASFSYSRPPIPPSVLFVRAAKTATQQGLVLYFLLVCVFFFLLEYPFVHSSCPRSAAILT